MPDPSCFAQEHNPFALIGQHRPGGEVPMESTDQAVLDPVRRDALDNEYLETSQVGILRAA